MAVHQRLMRSVLAASSVALAVIALRRSLAREGSPVGSDAEMAECKLCKSHRRTTETTELFIQGAFKAPDTPVIICPVCDSGEGEVDGALALALANLQTDDK